MGPEPEAGIRARRAAEPGHADQLHRGQSGVCRPESPDPDVSRGAGQGDPGTESGVVRVLASEETMRALLWAVGTWGLGGGVVPPIPISQLLTPCQVTGLDSLKPRCATIQVLENRALPNGRKLNLRVVVVPPDSGAELPDPIVPVPGGPGGGTIGAGNGWARGLQAARGHRALVLIDPRGAAQSGALECDFSDGPAHPGSYVRDFAPPAKVRECAATLSRRADLTQYHTEAIADDLAEVLTALGYDRVNLYGVSG